MAIAAFDLLASLVQLTVAVVTFAFPVVKLRFRGNPEADWETHAVKMDSLSGEGKPSSTLVFPSEGKEVTKL